MAIERRLQEPGKFQVDIPSYADFQIELNTRPVDNRAAYRTVVHRLLEANRIEPIEQDVAEEPEDIWSRLMDLQQEVDDEVLAKKVCYAAGALGNAYRNAAD